MLLVKHMCISEISETCSDVLFVMQWHSDMLSVFFRLLSLTDSMWLSLNHSTLSNGCFVPHLFIKAVPRDFRRHQHLLKSSWWPWVNIPELTQMLGLSHPIRWLPSCLYPSSFIEITRLQRSRTQLRLCATFKRTSQLILLDVCPTVSFTTPLKQKGFERELSAHSHISLFTTSPLHFIAFFIKAFTKAFIITARVSRAKNVEC